MAIIGMDTHRSFAQAAFLRDGQVKQEQRVDLVHDRLVKFAKTLSSENEVVIEATGNSGAVERILRPFVNRVVVANPRMVRAIAYARVKTDKIDAAVLARLHAGGFLPEVWVADDDTQRRRRQTAERMGVLEQMVRTKGRIYAILHANLIPKYSGHLFGKAGKDWLSGLPLPDEERRIVGQMGCSTTTILAQPFSEPDAGAGAVHTITLLNQVREKPALPKVSSCRDCLAPRAHRHGAKRAMRLS